MGLLMLLIITHFARDEKRRQEPQAGDEQEYTTNELIVDSDDTLANSINMQNQDSINMAEDAKE